MALCKTFSVGDSDGNPVLIAYVPATLSKSVINWNTSGDHTQIAGVALKTTKLYKMIILPVAADVTITLKDGAGALAELTIPLFGGGNVELNVDKYAHAELTVGNDLKVNLSANVQVSGYILYLQD